MEGNEKVQKIFNGISKNVELNIADYQDISCLDLSNTALSSLSGTIQLPASIINLKLANNKLTEVPEAVINLKNLKILHLSHNLIQYFNHIPKFCHSIELLNISYNKLEGPPLWVWTEQPKKLVALNLSNNEHLSKSFTNGYLEDLLEYKTVVIEIDVNNCKLLNKHIKFLSTFSSAKEITIGCEDYNYFSISNRVENVPCEGLDQCHDIERLYMCNNHIYTIEKNIDIYKHLKEINLAQNCINGLPNEFCNLVNLHTCILSRNNILYLPDYMHNLIKLEHLYLDGNELCMLPDTLKELPNLKALDLYDNHLCETLDWVQHLEKYDCAQNYLEEPNNDEYLVQKQNIRENCHIKRKDGRKAEVINDESDYKSTDTDDEDLLIMDNNEQKHIEAQPNTRTSSPEDWDSDDYWIPLYYKQHSSAPSRWLFFVKQKMEEGNFCPMDVHPISVADKIKYERQINPPIVYESDGQFDDYSEDDT